MQAELQTDDAWAKHKRRKPTGEPVFGSSKNVLCVSRFHCPGLDMGKNTLSPAILADNSKQIVRLRTA
jgi:hypothetical protein